MCLKFLVPPRVSKNANWFKVSKRVSLPINTEKVDEKFVPKDIAYEDNKKTLEQVAIGIAWKMPTLLIGETGTGKTSMIRHIAHKTHNAFVRVNHNGGTTIEDLVGRWTIDGVGKTVWVDGILVQAMKKGWYFLADEINAASAEINFVYHALLDDDARILLAEKGDEVVVPHKNFRFFGAMNPPTEYAGTKELNKALLSRFMVVNVDFPAPKTEQKILIERTGIAEDVAERMVRQAGEVRIMHAKEEVRYVFSTRDLIMWANMFKVYASGGLPHLNLGMLKETIKIMKTQNVDYKNENPELIEKLIIFYGFSGLLANKYSVINKTETETIRNQMASMVQSGVPFSFKSSKEFLEIMEKYPEDYRLIDFADALSTMKMGKLKEEPVFIDAEEDAFDENCNEDCVPGFHKCGK